ncbi:MAG: sulfite exporter TauE/SafE family protein [Verrucomicrobiota bacterium]
MTVDYETWQWFFFSLSALIIGMSKCGVPGLSILNVAIFQNLLLSKDATGFGLPLLIVGDIVAVLVYKRHAVWKQLWRLFPAAAAGVVLAYFALRVIDNSQAKVIVSLILGVLLLLHFLKSRGSTIDKDLAGRGKATAALVGALSGFVSMVANAAGPIMVIYLLSMRFDKMAFMGTSVYFFLFLNFFKVPFLVDLEMINLGSLEANLKLVPFILVGAALGYFFAKKINQKWFEGTAFWLTVVAVVHMLWTALMVYI